MLGCVFVLGLMARTRWRIDDALLTLLVLYFGVTHIRFLLLAGLVLPPILAPQFGRLSSYDPRRERRLLNATLLLIVLGVCALGFPSTPKCSNRRSPAFSPRTRCSSCVSIPNGEGCSIYFNGEGTWNGIYRACRRLWTAAPTSSTIKGILKDYLSITGLNSSEELLDRYRISYVLFPADTPLSYFLSKSRSWQPIYRDPQAVIYRHRSDNVRQPRPRTGESRFPRLSLSAAMSQIVENNRPVIRVDHFPPRQPGRT